jgi:UDP-N-acetylmuramyl pentapeptide phosphotransferase/UDP-N-acetylglucosamine-1-phosphate transferase
MDFVDGLAAAVTVAAGSFALSWALTGRVLAWLRHRAILDQPNERSSHSVPTPRGGGWGIMLTVLPVWAVIGVLVAPETRFWIVPAALALLMAVSWADDRRGLGAAPRFLIQIAAVAAGLFALPDGAGVFQGLLPLWLDRVLAALAWVWFVNLFNFMDGIDGIAGGEAASAGAGLALIGWLAGYPAAEPLLALAVAGAACGFLVWNWHPARLFMGDVGSVPLGYVLGFLLLSLATRGAWAAAVLLPAYFLADATLTLLRRGLRGERVWRAHREHFYQRATQNGRRHDKVVRAVLIANAVLIALSAGSLERPWLALASGAVVTVFLLRHLSGRPRPVSIAAGSGTR